MTLHLNATPAEVMRAVEALWEFGRASGIPEKTLFGLALALEECSSNIVNHAFQKDAGRKFKVLIRRRGDVLTIELRDRGPRFDPTRPIQGRLTGEDAAGGWGIDLARRYTDEMRYRRASGENVLRLSKQVR